MTNTISKEEQYQSFLKICQSVIEGNPSQISSYAHICALLREHFNWHWVGFYLVNDERKQLEVGPYQGPLACTYIPFDKGVCGRCFREKKVQVVGDVHAITDHIACSALTNSEIVVPIFDQNNDVISVLDIDSTAFNDFDDVDARYLAMLAELL